MSNYQELGQNTNYSGPMQVDRFSVNRPGYRVRVMKTTLPDDKVPTALSAANDIMASVYRKIGVDEATIAQMTNTATPDARNVIATAADLCGTEIPVFEPRYKQKG